MTASVNEGDRRVWERPLLIVGFLSLAGAIMVAYNNPTTGYELSIYTATPIAVWAAVGAALIMALCVAFVSPISSYRFLALVLAACSVFAVISLPLIRGYYFYGTADPLTHIGFAKNLARGELSPYGMIYPGVHTLSVFITRITGYPLTRSLLIVILCFVLVYFVFVPLCVRLLVSGSHATVLGLFSALLLLPINHISTHLRVHPFTLTVLYSSFVIFLLLKVFTNRTISGRRSPDVRSKKADTGPKTITGTLLALALAVTAVVLYHPQQALNLLILFVTVCGIQLFYRLFYSSHPVSKHPTMYASTAFFFGVYILWTVRTGWFRRLASKHLNKIMAYIDGRGTAGQSIQSQGASLSVVGASLTEIFVKLFLLGVVYALLTAIITLFSLYHGIDDSVTEEKGMRLYISLSVVPMVIIFFVYLAGSISGMQFRHLGFLMLLATILGAVGLVLIEDRLTRVISRPKAGTVVAICFVFMLVLALAPIYQSPYIYKANLEVTEPQMEGYNTAFDIQTPDTEIRGVRIEPTRYSDATQGVAWTLPREELYRKTVPAHGLSRLQPTLDGTQYVIVTQMDEEREVTAYRELKYSRQGFQSLDNQPGVNRVMSNGEVQLYYVEDEEADRSSQARLSQSANRATST